MAAEKIITVKEMEEYFKDLEKVLTSDIPLDGYFDRAQMAIKVAALNCFDQGVDPWGNPWAPVKFRVRDAGGTLQPLRDRGILMASMTADNADGAIRERGTDFLRYGTNLEYAAVHNYGNTTIPKQAKYLCIPVTLEALRSGSPRNFPRPLTPIINKSKDGGVLLEKNGDQEIVHYAMTVEVIIPARPFIGFTDTLANKLVLIFDDWLLGQGSAVAKVFNRAA